MNQKELKDLREALEANVFEKLGVKTEMSVSVNSRDRIMVRSNDLKEHGGILSSFYEEFYIKGYGNYVSRTDDIREYSVSLDFRWKYNVGGSNGHDLMHLCRVDGEWITDEEYCKRVRDVGETEL